jgi:hypothetical protein
MRTSFDGCETFWLRASFSIDSLQLLSSFNRPSVQVCFCQELLRAMVAGAMVYHDFVSAFILFCFSFANLTTVSNLRSAQICLVHFFFQANLSIDLAPAHTLMKMLPHFTF